MAFVFSPFVVTSSVGCHGKEALRNPCMRPRCYDKKTSAKGPSASFVVFEILLVRVGFVLDVS